jgi:hypothetical protein
VVCLYQAVILCKSIAAPLLSNTDANQRARFSSVPHLDFIGQFMECRSCWFQAGNFPEIRVSLPSLGLLKESQPFDRMNRI